MTDVVTKRAQATVTSGDTGAFDVVLSSSALDREGEVLLPGDWQQPLPSVIPINVDHSKSVRDVVGSGRPFIDVNGNLRVKGVFASNPEAQHVRSLGGVPGAV